MQTKLQNMGKQVKMTEDKVNGKKRNGKVTMCLKKHETIEHKIHRTENNVKDVCSSYVFTYLPF